MALSSGNPSEKNEIKKSLVAIYQSSLSYRMFKASNVMCLSLVIYGILYLKAYQRGQFSTARAKLGQNLDK